MPPVHGRRETAWILRRMDGMEHRLIERIDAGDDKLTARIDAAAADVTELKVAVARLEGPVRHLIVPAR